MILLWFVGDIIHESNQIMCLGEREAFPWGYFLRLRKALLMKNMPRKVLVSGRQVVATGFLWSFQMCQHINCHIFVIDIGIEIIVCILLSWVYVGKDLCSILWTDHSHQKFHEFVCKSPCLVLNLNNTNPSQALHSLFLDVLRACIVVILTDDNLSFDHVTNHGIWVAVSEAIHVT